MARAGLPGRHLLRRVLFLVESRAMRVSAGALAAMNNAKIPLAVACSCSFFGEKAIFPDC